MPTVEYSFTELCNLLGKKYSPEELSKSIPMIGVGLEEINEEKLVVEVFPNRPDYLSLEGFARALKGFLSIETGLPAYSVKPSGIKFYVEKSVKEVRPALAVGVAKGVDLSDEQTLISLMNIQEKLHLTHGRNRAKVAIGVHDLDKVVAPFTYKAVEPDSVKFVPLDMTEKLSLKQILSRHPKGRDYAWILEGKTKYPLFVDANGDVLSFPPIINGELTRLREETRNLFLDLTGTSQLAVEQALNIICCGLADRGAEIQSVEVIYRD
ncbi:MAG: phenylalanine--tRNA ligase subunit beta [Candidatus Altiarchaeota archaeon]